MNASSHLLTTCDGVRLAWAASGHGLPLVRAANWLTHLDHDAGSPVWRHWLRFLAGHYRYVRYDERGCGLSDWEVGELALESWIGDLETSGERRVGKEVVSTCGYGGGRYHSKHKNTDQTQ